MKFAVVYMEKAMKWTTMKTHDTYALQYFPIL